MTYLTEEEKKRADNLFKMLERYRRKCEEIEREIAEIYTETKRGTE